MGIITTNTIRVMPKSCEERQSGALLALSMILMLVMVAVLTGCGYTFRNSGTVLPSTVKKIYIPFAENRSTEGQLTRLLTEALRDEFERYGVVTVVEEPSEADATLRITIMELKRRSLTVAGRSSTDNQRTTSLLISGELKDRGGKVLWQEPALNVGKGFGTSRAAVVTSGAGFVGGTLGAGDLANLGERELQRGQEQSALSDLADEAATQIYEEAVAEPF